MVRGIVEVVVGWQLTVEVVTVWLWREVRRGRDRGRQDTANMTETERKVSNRVCKVCSADY
jgi:hypothetical protein